MTPCLFLINFNHIFLHSQLPRTVIISNPLTFEEKPEWIHWNIQSLTIWFSEFLEMCRPPSSLQSESHCTMSSDSEFNVCSFLIPQVPSRRFCLLVKRNDDSFTQSLLRKVVALGRQDLAWGLTNPSLPHSTPPQLRGLLLHLEY